ncbi:MAG: translation initiation factor IF-2 [Bacteroidales bacterium]|nr:translation initiation factor IF-2 [Bacteroidales bacterium]
MAANKKPLRLSRVAREFNLGIQTIAEFLNNKGIEVDAKPNSKIDPEAYDLLVQEFESDKTAKEESEKIGLSHAKRESVSIEDQPQEETTETPEEEGEELIIHGVQSDKTDVVSENQEENDQKEKETNAELTEDSTEDTSGISQKDEKQVSDKDKTDEKQQESINESPEDTGDFEKESFAESSHTEDETKEKKKEEKVEKEETDKKQKSKQEADKENGVNIQGKIDLDKIENSTRPKKSKKKTEEKEPSKQTEKTKDKTKEVKKKDKTQPTEDTKQETKSKPEELKKEKPEKPQEPLKEKIDKTKEENNEKGFVKTEFEKLKGPNILGKIDLPASKQKDSKKKPVASSTDDKVGKSKKKKRKRIKKAIDPNAQQKAGEGKKQKQKADEPKQQSKRQKRKSKRKQVKHEPTEEEIQKQIKETLEKLSGGGKSKAAKHRREKRKVASESRIKEEEKKEQEQEVLQVTEFVTANELANMMEVDVNEVISACMSMGMFVSINQRLDAETITILADEFGYEVDFVSVEEQEEVDEEEEQDDPEKLQPRSPIVTVMGHVDHGKTSLLDYIRKANVIAGEAGGITQHVGAYEVELPDDRSITFLDTPGHEAFTAMRARGANITDIAIIVIASDDRIMPQTKEAINHAQAAGVPIIFAINKIDKPGADPDKVKQELANMNLLVEDWGGKYQSQDISAKHGQNVDNLLEKVLLEAELLELKANPDKHAVGTVLESSLDRGRGYVAKLLVQGGTMKIGDIVLAGSHYGRVKAMYNERNQEVETVGPSEPVLMLGLHGAPNAGDSFSIMIDEREAKNIATKRQQLQREQGIRSQKHVTLDEIGRRIAIGDFKELNVIVKGDVDGSVEALADELLKLSNEEVQVNVIHKSVGAIIESDVLLASASDAIIIGFQVRPSMGARKLADQEQIDIRTYSVIYEAKQQVMDAIEGLLSPEVKEKVVANLEVRNTFKITKVGTVAGCYVLDGKLHRNTDVRLIRDGIVVYTGKLGSLKRYKDDVKEVVKGYECGLNIENFNDIKVGDIIEGFETYEVKRSLDDMKSNKK